MVRLAATRASPPHLCQMALPRLLVGGEGGFEGRLRKGRAPTRQKIQRARLWQRTHRRRCRGSNGGRRGGGAAARRWQGQAAAVGGGTQRAAWSVRGGRWGRRQRQWRVAGCRAAGPGGRRRRRRLTRRRRPVPRGGVWGEGGGGGRGGAERNRDSRPASRLAGQTTESDGGYILGRPTARRLPRP